jgi:hypothetical protein
MTASWVIVEIKTGKAVFETFERKTADHVRDNMTAWRVVPIMAWLQSLNNKGV